MSAEESVWLEQVRRSDDRVAFAHLVRLHEGAVRSFLRRLVGSNDTLADELAQDTFVTAHRLRERFRPDGKYRTWLLGIARNLQRNAARSRTLDVVSLETDIHQPTAAREPDLEPLHAALRELSPEQQQTLHLYFQEQLSIAEISEVLALPVGTVKSHLSRGKDRLRTLLSPRHERA